MTPTNIRARLVAAEARRIELVTDGLPDRWCSTKVRDRLYRLQAGEEVIVPGWLAGNALNLSVFDRAANYKITTDDQLIPVSRSTGSTGGLPIGPPQANVRRIPAGMWLERAANEDQDDDDEDLAA